MTRHVFPNQNTGRNKYLRGQALKNCAESDWQQVLALAI